MTLYPLCMSENKKHIDMKYRLVDIAKTLGYHCKVEMKSPKYMSFFTGKQKQRIDVWCEYYENRKNILCGRQIPIEIYYSEKVTKIKLDPVYNDFKLTPSKSFRLVVCGSIERPYTVTNEQSNRYFDLHIIPWDALDIVKQCLEIGKEYLIYCFKPKIDGIETNVAGVFYSDIKKVSNFHLWTEIDTGIELQLEREPNNKCDRNAIKVLYKDCQIGYVPKEHARNLAQLIDCGNNYSCFVDSKSGTLLDYPKISIQIRNKST